jgi:tetratricopeptide (TPR) repeat protein
MSNANEALQLAVSYYSEVIDRISAGNISVDEAAQLLETVNLAEKQIKTAERVDPGVSITVEGPDGERSANLLDIKSRVLTSKGILLSIRNKLPAAAKYIENGLEFQEDSMARSVLAGVYADQNRYVDAIKHLERAIELEPDNVEFKKELDRLRSLAKKIKPKFFISVVASVAAVLVVLSEPMPALESVAPICIGVLLIWAILIVRDLLKRLASRLPMLDLLTASPIVTLVVGFIAIMIIVTFSIFVAPYMAFVQSKQLKALS